MYDIVRDEIESVNGLAALNMDTVTAISNLANQAANSVATVTNSFANLNAAKNGTTTTNNTTTKKTTSGGSTVMVGENTANPYAYGGSLYDTGSSTKKETDWTPFIIGGAVGLGLLLIMMNNKKK